MSVESVLEQVRVAGICVFPMGSNLRVRGPVEAVNKWTPRLREYRSVIEVRIASFMDRIEQARQGGLLNDRDVEMAMLRCADPAAWQLWESVIAGAEAARTGS